MVLGWGCTALVETRRLPRAERSLRSNPAAGGRGDAAVFVQLKCSSHACIHACKHPGVPVLVEGKTHAYKLSVSQRCPPSIPCHVSRVPGAIPH